jgi:hypothetical protein
MAMLAPEGELRNGGEGQPWLTEAQWPWSLFLMKLRNTIRGPSRTIELQRLLLTASRSSYMNKLCH